MTDIDDLFSRDPLSLTNDQVEQLVEVVRLRRETWAAEEIASKNEGRRAKASAGVKVKIDLDQLNISI